MFWNKNKKEEQGLPELPSMQNRPSMQEYDRKMSSKNRFNYPPPKGKDIIEDEFHDLPSFPDSAMKRGFSQSAIKNAIEDEEDFDEGLPKLPDLPEERAEITPGYQNQPSRTMEMEEWHPKHLNPPPMSKPSPRNENKPVFIRIDKFTNARESLETIKNKLSEIDDLLKTIREVKSKEDHEISSWEKEIEYIKSRINSIVTDIFDSSYS